MSDGPKYAEAYENQTWADYGISWADALVRPDLNPKERVSAGNTGKAVSDKKK